MTPRLWFVVPVHGRERLTGICLRQLRRTCDALNTSGIYATAVIVGDDTNLDTAHDLGFATVERDNRLAMKFNDGIQLAFDPRHNPEPAHYVVPCGSDDWVDHRLFLDLPNDYTLVGFPHLAVVREDGREIACRQITYTAGSGIRIYPAALMRPLDYRPADEDRTRACDTSILTNLRQKHGERLRIEHRRLHDFQIVDWKSPSEQMNSYDELGVFRAAVTADPFEALAGTYPVEALDEMREHYAHLGARVAA